MISVRRFEEADAGPLASLMMEMVGFYGAAVSPDLVVADDVIRQARKVDIVVAFGEGGLVGFATFATLYPVAGLLAFTYIQQVYVGCNGRRLGVAQKLMAEIAQVAKAQGSTRVEWSTGTENTAARALYEGLGAEGYDKVYYVLEGMALDQLAGQRDEER